jgi:hypothetical protein
MNEEQNRPLSTTDIAHGTSSRPDGGDGISDPDVRLVPEERSDDLRRQWEDIQTRFVDEPRQSVEEADGLVAEVLRIVADGYASERAALEAQWGSGEDVSTEALRLTLQRYREFFNRLLTA